MTPIPDAPWIREAESRGTDYMYGFVYGEENDDEEEENV